MPEIDLAVQIDHAVKQPGIPLYQSQNGEKCEAAEYPNSKDDEDHTGKYSSIRHTFPVSLA